MVEIGGRNFHLRSTNIDGRGIEFSEHAGGFGPDRLFLEPDNYYIDEERERSSHRRDVRVNGKDGRS